MIQQNRLPLPPPWGSASTEPFGVNPEFQFRKCGEKTTKRLRVWPGNSDLTDLRRTNSDSRCGVTIEITPTNTSSVQHVRLLIVYDKMATLVRIVSSMFPATTLPSEDGLLSRLIESSSTDKHFVKTVTDVVSSKEALIAAKQLSPYNAQRVINGLDKALDTAAIARNEHLWRRCLKYLYWICGHHRRLPSAYRLTSALRKGKTKLGHGGFGDVWKGHYNGRPVAVKVLRVSESSDLGNIEKRFCREVLMWSRRPHPNILPLLGASDRKFIMVSEWMANGNIREYVLANPSVNRPSLLLGAADGLMYLHSHKLVHGDLKGANILIKQDGLTSCLADFGLATIMPTEVSTLLSHPSTSGTIRYMSPELLDPGERTEFEHLGITVHSDRYAFGMVIYEVITGKIPFHQVSRDCAVVAKVVRGDRPKIPIRTPLATHVSGLWEVVRQCWAGNPLERPPLCEIREGLSVAAEMWLRDPGQSGSIVNVPSNVLLSSVDFSNTGNNHEVELGTSSYSLVQCSWYATPERATNPPGFDKGTPRDRSPQRPRAAPPQSSEDEGAPHRHGSSTPCAPEGLWGIQPRLYDLRQSLVASMQSIVFVGHEGDDQSDNAGLESDSDSEPPSFVYAKKKS